MNSESPRGGELVTQHSRTQPVSGERAELVMVDGEAEPLTDAQLEKLHTRLTQANLCRMRSQWDEAIDHCVAVLQLQPGNATAHSLLGDIYREQGKLDDAIQWYRMAIDLKPNASDSLKLARLEAQRNQLMVRSLKGGGARALTPDSLDTIGTRNLAGNISPRKWLNALTAASLAFVGLMMIGLVYAQRTRKPETNKTAASNGAFGQTLPNATPSVAPLPPAYSSNPAPFTQGAFGGGTGLAPDRPASSPMASPAPTPPITEPARPASQTAPAPVYRTSPLPSIPPPSPQGGAGLDGRPQTSQPTRPLDATQLGNGLSIVGIDPRTSSESKNVTVEARRWTDNESARRSVALGMVKAAQTLFARDPATQRVSISVYGLSPNNERYSLASGSLTRAGMVPGYEGFPLAELERLAQVQWSLASSPQEASYGSVDANN